MPTYTRDIRQLLQTAYSSKASDLHISVGSSPVIRMDGTLHPLEGAPVTADEAAEMAEALLGSERNEVFRNAGEVDFSYPLDGGVRFRVNVYRQRGEISIAARAIPAEIPSLEQLSMPPILSTLSIKPQGLILVTGPTGSGKSSTLAAMLNYINKTESKHIVTLEDPIEFLHSHGTCLVDQREVGNDTASFASGLRAALRQDPDVILVGEMRDLETITAAVTAAETGHLVMATLHTTDAPQTIDRIIDAFPGHQQGQIRSQLASVLLAVVSQRLFPRAGGRGRICATEILVNTPAVANLIRTEKTHQIKNVMQTGRAQGMHTLDMSIRDYLSQGLIDSTAVKAFMTEVGN
ncbi:type IV pili twitching motility protein PilT [Paenibacillus sp. VTT E-133280]|uniref:type IV pilus twitching motility protein PilT n=1 Tax=Paenibacillus sp. VTT E-133280 TaxID=1986222 RepID=UPI000B9FE69C|nr:type IV pilus twitching motility protein PilT [Paenibacillus sp. VTT E-133280]OZQ63756.1 type IV pili twitching motility protein PilT [Paenibacillus sp. VTT E-133280]